MIKTYQPMPYGWSKECCEMRVFLFLRGPKTTSEIIDALELDKDPRDDRCNVVSRTATKLRKMWKDGYLDRQRNEKGHMIWSYKEWKRMKTNVAKLNIKKSTSKKSTKRSNIVKLGVKSLGEQAAKGRYSLQSEIKARRQAAGRSGWLKSQGKFDYGLYDHEEGANLLKGVAGMTDAISDQLTQEQYNKLMSMEGDKLSALYQNNAMVFEVFYNYGGISKDSSGANRVDESKAKEAQFLIDQYEKFFGEIQI